MPSKIAIIGVGEVGANAAYTLLLNSVCSELLLVDVNCSKRDGQVHDLSNATFRENSRTRVRAATHKEAGQCDIVVLTAGSKRSIGESSLQMMYRNTSILRSAINAMKPFRADTVLLLVTSPVDLLTSLAQDISGLPSAQVIGSGTFLDSVRLRGLVAEKLGISASSIDAYILGQHGDSQFVAWSSASVGGIPLDDAVPPGTLDKASIAHQCNEEDHRIIESKGALAFGIGSVISSICASILFDKRQVRPISHFRPQLGCCLSLPAVIGRQGIVRPLTLKLSAEEQEKLDKSAESLRGTVAQLKEGGIVNDVR